ncbi:nitrous oxide reductase accessory protein NosL [Melioribacteraceae bacterium 4301-Me]|uniref:nitrous oxide reductase accessory protein NosL n=1 Tax=Pyranulibacter aquaticus TaxID=3163344 RepID=UPI00359669AB
MKKYILLILFFVSIGCSNKPEPVSYGSDSCSNCKMLITDPKFGSEIVTTKGKIFKFDSIECMAYFSTKLGDAAASFWVTDFSQPEDLMEAKNSFFLKSDKIKSPMGMNLAAFANKKELQTAAAEFNGSQLTWKEVVNYVKKQWN